MNYSSLTGGGNNVQVAAGESGAFFHAEDAQAGAVDGAFPDPVDVEADAIVADLEVEQVILQSEFDGDGGGTGVAHDIG
ncbi:MAG TPA: hypothetical protein VN673_09910, partial [Clostridia bacterium]|nr:hypothetical protein [Clostridia bacterium]